MIAIVTFWVWVVLAAYGFAGAVFTGRGRYMLLMGVSLAAALLTAMWIPE